MHGITSEDNSHPWFGFPEITVEGVRNAMCGRSNDGKIKLSESDKKGVWQGCIVSIHEYGLFVKFVAWEEKEYEGLVHISRFPGYDGEKALKDQCKVGDKVKVKVLSAERDPMFDEASLRIALECVERL